MRVLMFRHVPFEGAGHLERILQARGIAFDYADLYQPSAAVPAIEAYRGLIFLGGPMSVNDPLAYLEREMEYIGRAIASGIPVLGICLGAQLIAKSLGARVCRNRAPEIGWFELEFTGAASGDALFDGLERETVFHWHGETFDLPPGAELLASSALCANQAYRVGRGVYGLQFHLEVTPAMIADWCTQDANCSDMREVNSPPDPYYNAERLALLADRVFGKWCEIVRRPKIMTRNG